jgi:hypothetical protein
MVPHARQPLARAPTFGNHLGLDDLARYCERYRPLPMSSIAAELEGMTSILINGEQALREGIRHLVEDHRRSRVSARPPGRSPERAGDRRRPGIPGVRQARRAQAPRARHQGAATGHQRLHPALAALSDRARVRPAGALAPPLALLRDRQEPRPAPHEQRLRPLHCDGARRRTSGRSAGRRPGRPRSADSGHAVELDRPQV